MPITTTNMGLQQAQGSDNARDYLKTYLATSLDLIDKHDHSSTKGVPVKRLANGTFASRPAAGNAGHVYVATDSNRVTWDNGASWIDAVINGTTQATTLGNGLTITAGGILVDAGGVTVASGTLAVGPTPYAAAGQIRLANTQLLAWRNGTDTGDDALYFDSSDRLVIAGPAVATTATAGGVATTPTTNAGYLSIVVGANAYKLALLLP